jgi:hypothetical protein
LLALLANILGAIRVSAFYAPDDLLFSRRGVVVTSDGAILEIKYGPDGEIITTELPSLGGAIEVAVSTRLIAIGMRSWPRRTGACRGSSTSLEAGSPAVAA